MVVPPESLPPRPGPAAILLGVVRVAASLALLVGGTVAVLVAAMLPARPDAARPVDHLVRALCRALLAVAGVQRATAGLDRLAHHRGFVFFNHSSYLDPLVLVAATPMRFLATAGVRRLPFVGPMATALGTIYVHRGQGPSRAAARRDLREAVRRSPVPIALAPEGRIGPGPQVQPLRHGAFEVAADADAPIVLVALRFEPAPYAAWQDREWLLRAFWRLCARTTPVTASLTILGKVKPGTVADSPTRAREAEQVLNRALWPAVA